MPETLNQKPEYQAPTEEPQAPEVKEESPVVSDGTNQPKVDASAPKEDDLMSRVSQFMNENVPVPEEELSDDSFDLKEIENIQDPFAKEQAMKAYKSFQRGFNKKFEQVAELRKNMEQSQPVSQAWTPERIQELMNDPQFISAATQVAGDTSSNDSLEYVDPEVKKVIDELKNEVSSLKNQSQSALQKQNEAVRIQQHQQLQAKYANYNPQEIDTITQDMLNGKIQATPEHIYKAFKFEDNMKAAYEMGRKDERSGVNVKADVASASADGIQTNAAVPKVEPIEGETSKSFMDRIIANVAAQAKHKR